jgi:lipopolysaccharide/colanic/teichoic acid biosynthesis glycosyltransferase|tara:strand:- start:336 stop:557 length:222 start_codon:yes stop_codon:yes gene_type:complete
VVKAKKLSKSDTLAHQRITDHEKLCRIMQEETNKKIKNLHDDIHRIEKILIAASGFLITSMLGLIVALIIQVF